MQITIKQSQAMGILAFLASERNRLKECASQLMTEVADIDELEAKIIDSRSAPSVNEEVSTERATGLNAQRVRKAFWDSKVKMTPKEVSAYTGLTYPQAKSSLHYLVERKEIKRTEKGVYLWTRRLKKA